MQIEFISKGASVPGEDRRIFKSDAQVKLEVVDIPITEKHIAMEDLNYMGVSAGALLPSLDGTCRMLKEMHFSS